MSRIVMIVSSVTGNTAMVADRLEEELEKEGIHRNLIEDEGTTGQNTYVRLSDKEAVSFYPEADLYISCFWCRKGGMNDSSIKFINHYQGKHFIAVGTMGSEPDTPYGFSVKEKVRMAVEEHNICDGVFVCRGKIPRKRIEARRQLPPDAPHYLDDDAYQRHLESLTHPDRQDLEAAAAFLKSELKKINLVDRVLPEISCTPAEEQKLVTK